MRLFSIVWIPMRVMVGPSLNRMRTKEELKSLHLDCAFSVLTINSLILKPEPVDAVPTMSFPL